MGCGQTCRLGAGMKKRVDTRGGRENVLEWADCDFTEKATNVRLTERGKKLSDESLLLVFVAGRCHAFI
jgi:hypothetical protein